MGSRKDGRLLEAVGCVPGPSASVASNDTNTPCGEGHAGQQELCAAQAPQPLDARLSLDIAGGEILAIMRFEGSATREATGAAVGRLRRALAAGAPPLQTKVGFP